MSEPETTTLSGNVLWIVVGILGFMGVLILLGYAAPPSRPYVVDMVKLILGFLPSVAALK